LPEFQASADRPGFQARLPTSSKGTIPGGDFEMIVITDQKTGKSGFVLFNKKGQAVIPGGELEQLGKVWEKGKEWFSGYKNFEFKSDVAGGKSGFKSGVNFAVLVPGKVFTGENTVSKVWNIEKSSPGSKGKSFIDVSVDASSRIGTETGSGTRSSAATKIVQDTSQSQVQDVQQINQPVPVSRTRNVFDISTERPRGQEPVPPPAPPFNFGKGKSSLSGGGVFNLNNSGGIGMKKGLGMSSYISKTREEMITGRPASEWSGSARVKKTEETERKGFLGGVETPFMERLRKDKTKIKNRWSL